MTKPVYIINGFLESGKTEFITFTLGQPYFQIKGKTLLILCEEGENEYDPALLKKSRTDVVLIEEEEEFTPNHLIELEKQYKPARIIIEYNGMWNCKNMTLPWYFRPANRILENTYAAGTATSIVSRTVSALSRRLFTNHLPKGLSVRIVI